MQKYCQISSRSLVIDVGSGLGKPSFAIANKFHPLLSFGVEVEYDRWKLSMANLKGIFKKSMAENSRTSCHGTWFINADILDAVTFDPFTILYQFDRGMPADLFYAMAEKFNNRLKTCNT